MADPKLKTCPYCGSDKFDFYETSEYHQDVCKVCKKELQHTKDFHSVDVNPDNPDDKKTKKDKKTKGKNIAYTRKKIERKDKAKSLSEKPRLIELSMIGMAYYSLHDHAVMGLALTVHPVEVTI